MLPKGPKPKGPFPPGPRPGSAAASPPPAPGSAPGEGHASRRAHRRPLLQPSLFAAAGLLIALVTVLLYRAVDPPPPRPTPRDIAAAVEKALKERKPEPPIAARAYQAVRPSLVLVHALGPEPRAEDSGAIGTGVVVEDTGTILTNLHVVAGAAALRVVFADGFETDAAVVGVQPDNDLAVLQPAVVPDDLVPATLTGSGHLRAGDEVVAVGHPFGISNSVTAGVVSGLGRAFVSPQSGTALQNLIQFDAAVNPGNSGGPLLDRNGEVVGIVTAILNPIERDFFVGIGFAVTIETAVAGLGIPPW
jgi:S1-C subfamily serine protease